MFFAFHAWKNIRRIEDEKLKQTQEQIDSLVLFSSSSVLPCWVWSMANRIELWLYVLFWLRFPKKNEMKTIEQISENRGPNLPRPIEPNSRCLWLPFNVHMHMRFLNQNEIYSGCPTAYESACLQWMDKNFKCVVSQMVRFAIRNEYKMYANKENKQ